MAGRSLAGPEKVLVGSPVLIGDGSGVADSGADGEGVGVGTRVGRGRTVGLVRPGVGAGAAGRDRRCELRSRSSGSTGTAGASAGAAHGGPVATGVRLGRAGGWVPSGRGSTTGPTDGVGMNGVLVSGRALLPTVADPVLIAARIGMDAVPASSATVKR
ncbi:hypothetical protein ABZ570_19520 [Micromonospora sp. NPDC007271]|uniref:hypothetical protein n=1 Tax=Micromonospora sp. NPDC007271 TaxID=3154587 RepID=UPI0033D90181